MHITLRSMRCFLVWLYMFGGWLAADSIHAQPSVSKRIALVVGNAQYQSVAALKNPGTDAGDVADSLRRLGFEVTLAQDAGRDMFNRKVAEFAQRSLGDVEMAVFYFAGHAVQLDWANYLLPVDIRVTKPEDIRSQGVALTEVIGQIKRAGARNALIIVDACRDNPFRGIALPKGLAQMDAPAGTYIAYATAPGSVARDGEGDSANGLYTRYLLREMRVPAKIEDMFKRVRTQVRQSSTNQQIPWDSSSLEQDIALNDGRTFRFELAHLQQEHERWQKAVDEASKKVDSSSARQSGATDKDAVALRKDMAAAVDKLKEAQIALDRLKAIERVPAAMDSEVRFQQELTAWSAVQRSQSVNDYYEYLKVYPSGLFAEQVKLMLEKQLVKERYSQADARQMQSLTPVGEVFRPGDNYVLRTTDMMTGKTHRYTVSVDRIDQGKVHLLTNAKNPEIRTLDGAVESTRSTDGVWAFDPPRLDVPADGFVVGKKWVGRTLQTKVDKGTQTWRDDEIRVEAYETVTLPAGVFKAYRLVMRSMLENGYSVRRTYWMEPGWGYPIKLIREVRKKNNELSLHQVVELVERQKGRGVSPPG